MSLENTRTCATSWSEAMRLAREQKYSTKIELPKEFAGPIPREFEQSALSIPNGATAVYRDQRAQDSYQIREYDDRYTIEMDQHNPEAGNAVAHAVVDAPLYTAAAIVGLGALLNG